MPQITSTSVADYIDRMNRAMTLEELLGIFGEFADAYQSGMLSRGEYDTLLNVYPLQYQRLSGAAPPPPPPPPSPKPPAKWAPGEWEATLPQAAWLRGLGLPAYGQNPYQEWLANQVGPAYAAWKGQQTIPGAVPQAFDPTWWQAQKGVSALDVLRQAKGLPGEEQERWGGEVGGTAGLSAIMQAAMRGKGYATPIADIIARRVPDIRTAWEAQYGGGAEAGTTFLKYLLEKMGLAS